MLSGPVIGRFPTRLRRLAAALLLLAAAQIGTERLGLALLSVSLGAATGFGQSRATGSPPARPVIVLLVHAPKLPAATHVTACNALNLHHLITTKMRPGQG
jgi:hypothetical protein